MSKHEPSRDLRPCTCHPDDKPPVPCARKFAYADCVLSAAMEEKVLALFHLSSCFGREVCPSRPCACARTISDIIMQNFRNYSRAGAKPRHSQPELITSRDQLASRDDASGPNSEFDSRDGSQKDWSVLDDCRALLEAVDHTISLHGHIDADTPLHERIRRTRDLISS